MHFLTLRPARIVLVSLSLPPKVWVGVGGGVFLSLSAGAGCAAALIRPTSAVPSLASDPLASRFIPVLAPFIPLEHSDPCQTKESWLPFSCVLTLCIRTCNDLVTATIARSRRHTPYRSLH